MVLSDAGVFDVFVEFLKLRIAFDRQVRFVSPHGDEERLAGVALVLQPAGGFFDNKRG